MPTSDKHSGGKPGSDPRLLVNILGADMAQEFAIIDVSHDFDGGFADAVEIKITTTRGRFTLWCQTAGQDRKLLVELGVGDKAPCYEVESDQ